MGIDKSRFDIKIGNLKSGKMNTIADVEGVKIGHVTLDNGRIKTGVTAILPHSGNIYKNKVIGAIHIINGFGKSIGLIQIDELGTIETPIILTNTLSVGTCATGLVKYMLDNNDDIGLTTGTVNPIVCECNDGWLNDIRELNVKEEHVLEAITNAKNMCQEGSVGAGTGMKCFGLKGGIGSSSRVIEFDNKEYTVGILVLSNFGCINRLTVDGKNIGKDIREIVNEKDRGSIIIVLATNIPLSQRQLKRLCKRVPAGLARTGSYYGNGSGDIVIGLSTANIINHYNENDLINITIIHDNVIDKAFEAVVEATEEAILSSMLNSETTIGRDNNKAISLSEII